MSRRKFYQYKKTLPNNIFSDSLYINDTLFVFNDDAEIGNWQWINDKMSLSITFDKKSEIWNILLLKKSELKAKKATGEIIKLSSYNPYAPSNDSSDTF